MIWEVGYLRLLFGIIFVLQILHLDEQNLQKMELIASEQMSQRSLTGDSKDLITFGELKIIDMSRRFEIAGYILLTISLMEILIISRFMD